MDFIYLQGNRNKSNINLLRLKKKQPYITTNNNDKIMYDCLKKKQLDYLYF